MKKQIKVKRFFKRLLGRLFSFLLLFGVMAIIITSSVAIGKYHFSETIVEKVEVTRIEREKAEDTVKKILDEAGIEWLSVFRLIECESRWDVFFKEKVKGGTYDRGLFAFNSYYYAQVSDECAFSPECATREFIKAYKAGNLNDWLCARLLKL